MTEDREFTISERVEGVLFGDIRHREGNFEAVAADVLRMSQAEVDEALAKEKKIDLTEAHMNQFNKSPRPPKTKVLSSRQLPSRLPVQLTCIAYLLLDKAHAPGWMWGAAGVLLSILWASAIRSLFTEEPTELHELK